MYIVNNSYNVVFLGKSLQLDLSYEMGAHGCTDCNFKWISDNLALISQVEEFEEQILASIIEGQNQEDALNVYFDDDGNISALGDEIDGELSFKIKGAA